MERLDGTPARSMVERRFDEIAASSLPGHVREAADVLVRVADERSEHGSFRMIADDLEVRCSHSAAQVAYLAIIAFDVKFWPPHVAPSRAVRSFESSASPRKATLRLRAAAKRLHANSGDVVALDARGRSK